MPSSPPWRAAAGTGNYAVFVPRGRYLIKGTLEVPANVRLEGVFDAPRRAATRTTAAYCWPSRARATPKGKPFITLQQSCTLRGLTVFYPEQKMKNPPVAYPWTIRGQGDNISLIDVLLVNPYQAVDFGTAAAGRHFISGLYGQPLYRGLFIDQCYDVGRIENVHFWTFWGGWEGELSAFMRSEAIAFILGRDGLGVPDQLLLHRLPHRLSLRRKRARPRQLPAHPMRLGHRADGRARRKQPIARRHLVRERPVHGGHRGRQDQQRPGEVHRVRLLGHPQRRITTPSWRAPATPPSTAAISSAGASATRAPRPSWPAAAGSR